MMGAEIKDMITAAVTLPDVVAITALTVAGACADLPDSV
jgi:hypothetical protein